MGAFVLVVILSMLCSNLKLVLGDIGSATSYDPPYTPTKCYGSGGDQFPPGNLFGAVSDGLWDNGSACGRHYVLRCINGIGHPCINGTVTIKVVDLCPQNPCPSTFVLSRDAFGALSKSLRGQINIEYIQV